MEKPRIFIGGTSEAKELAKQVKNIILSKLNAEVILWFDKGVFKFMESTLSSLIISRLFYDFTIIIATKDDITISREVKQGSPRDNLIFEFGLYLGGLGGNRCIFLQEEGIKLPSDFKGITLPRFSIKEEGLENQIDEVIDFINENSEYNELQILPSTTLAIGYYESFVKLITFSIHELSNKVDLGGKVSEDAIIKIIIPNRLSDDIGQKAKKLYDRLKLDKGEVKTEKRAFPVKFAYDKNNEEKAIIYDMPTTLNTIRPSCVLLLNKSQVGIQKSQSLVEKRELENFKSTLENLARENDYCDNLSVIWESEL